MMKVLMLGWEYPPHIAGGLGTACEGLTTALARRDVQIHFVVPHLYGGERAPHMVLIDAKNSRSSISTRSQYTSDVRIEGSKSVQQMITTERVDSYLQPYSRPIDSGSGGQYFSHTTERSVTLMRFARSQSQWIKAVVDGEVYGVDPSTFLESWELEMPFDEYQSDLLTEVQRFTSEVVTLMAGESFDIIHAHDWMTFPAAVALKRITNRPLVVHVHSLEYDRSGYGVNDHINQIERFGVEAADRVVPVSHYTSRCLERFHAVPAEKLRVVHNGVYPKQAVQNYRMQKAWPRNVVLFMGRVTFQKGPDYFVEVASRVIPHVPDVLFVLAGSGDMLAQMINRVKELKLNDYFLFPGFLRGEEVEEMYSVADLYVMPSVSEPFGISALEAISFDTPVIISKQSGVAEVLDNALRVDFWDLDKMADLIINGLLHEELRSELVSRAKQELQKLHWDAAAIRTVEIYEELLYQKVVGS